MMLRILLLITTETETRRGNFLSCRVPAVKEPLCLVGEGRQTVQQRP